MRLTSKILIGVGVLLMVLAGVWRVAVPSLAVKLPSNLDKTVQANGTFTLFMDPATKTPVAKPVQLPLHIDRRLWVLSSTNKTAVLKEHDVETIKGLAPVVLDQQYVVNRSTMKNVSSDQSWAYSPTAKVDRAPAYFPFFPFGTGSGPYQVWKNETGTTYPYHGVGTVQQNGISTELLQGSMTGAKVQSYYVDALSAVLPKTLTPTEAAAQLKSQGVDASALQTQVLPKLDPADQAEVISILTKPVNLNYTVDVAARMLIDKRTGSIVDLKGIDQTIYVSPDVAGIGRVQLILANQKYASQPVVVAAAQVLNKLVTSPPRLKAFSYTYSQTPASVKEISSYAKTKGDQIDLVKQTIPVSLLIFGFVVLGVGVVLFFVARRRQHPAEPPEPERPVSPRSPQQVR